MKPHFRWLQCVDNGELAFAVVNPPMILNDYDIEIPEETVSNLNIKHRDVMVLSIVVVPDDLVK